jgi:hypothetical protein
MIVLEKRRFRFTQMKLILSEEGHTKRGNKCSETCLSRTSLGPKFVFEGTGFQFMQVILNKDFIDWDFRRDVLDTTLFDQVCH